MSGMWSSKMESLLDEKETPSTMPSITFSIGGQDIDISNKSSDQVLDILKKECYKETPSTTMSCELQNCNGGRGWNTEESILIDKNALFCCGECADIWVEEKSKKPNIINDLLDCRKIMKEQNYIWEGEQMGWCYVVKYEANKYGARVELNNGSIVNTMDCNGDYLRSYNYWRNS